MKNESVIFIDNDGTVRGLESPLTKLLALKDRRRVSHIEPVNRLLRWLFHYIRYKVSDDSRLAGFTRRWPCRWQANIFDGPVLGPFRSRSEAVDAEVSWINEAMENERKVE